MEQIPLLGSDARFVNDGNRCALVELQWLFYWKVSMFDRQCSGEITLVFFPFRSINVIRLKGWEV